MTPTTENPNPTPCANRGGAESSRSRTGPRRGATRCRNTSPYGARDSPANAPMPNTTACAASSGHQPVINTTARTTVVSHAPKRGPRTSTCADFEVFEVGAVVDTAASLPGADCLRSVTGGLVRREGGSGAQPVTRSKRGTCVALPGVSRPGDTGCSRRGGSPPRVAWSASSAQARPYPVLPAPGSDVHQMEQCVTVGWITS